MIARIGWLAALVACAPTPEVEDDACDAVPAGLVALPADDAPHAEVVEWWYWTGHVHDADGHWYGFETAFFLTQLGSYVARSVHTALTDVDADAFHQQVTYEEGSYPLTTDGFDLDAAGQSATGGAGHDVISTAFGDEVGFELSLTAAKAPVLQHGDGYTDYDVGGYTYYYSRERMDTTGSISLGDRTIDVTGTSWFDHQYGNLLAASSAGWDWFALQLDDGREIMLFLVNGSTGVIGGSITDPGCHTREIDDDELTVTSKGTWTSPHTGCTYPMGWDVTIGDLSVEITPVRQDQEMPNTFKTYWEGASTVSGDATGRAYVELSGYCDDWDGTPPAR